MCKPCSLKPILCPVHKKRPEYKLDQALKTRISKWTLNCPNKCGEKFLVYKSKEHQCQSGKTNTVIA